MPHYEFYCERCKKEVALTLSIGQRERGDYKMKEEGAEVKVVGAGGAQSYASKHGYPVTVDVPRPTP